MFFIEVDWRSTYKGVFALRHRNLPQHHTTNVLDRATLVWHVLGGSRQVAIIAAGHAYGLSE